MSGDRKKPGVAFWATVVVAGIVGYPVSLVAVMHLYEHGILPEWLVASISWIWFPLIDSCYWLSLNGPEWMQPLLEWYDSMMP
jgi:hypothetical protein